MRCIYCGSPLSKLNYCPGCGADVTLLQRTVRISNLLYNRGLEKAGIRDLSGAVSCLKQSLKFNKENIDARNLLGLCYFETGEVVSALVEWVISKNMKPEDNLAGEYIQTLQNNRNKLDAINQTIRKYNQSIDYCRQGNEDMAVMQLRRVLSQNPKMVKAGQLLALLYMHSQEYERARRLLKKMLAVDNTNTTTLRYLTEIEDITGKTSAFSRKRSKTKEAEEPASRSLRYMSGNETIITPTTFRDSSTIATFINIMLGILLGAAIVWFLTVPAVRQSAQEKANREVTDANLNLATISATVQDLRDEVEDAQSSAEEAEKERDEADAKMESWEELLNVADLYVNGYQSAAVSAMEGLSSDDFDGSALSLYKSLSGAVGEALFSQYYAAGTQAYVNGDYEEAASQLQSAVDSDEDGSNERYYDALYYLGFAYFNAGNQAKANEVFSDFIAKYPNQASLVEPYMTTDAAGDGETVSQGEVSMQSSGAEASSPETDAASSQTDTAAGAETTAETQAVVAWTDPTTGQDYDMYGNPIYN